MSWYRDRILPHVIEHAASTGPLMKQRERVVPLASGRVLEVGFGTGLNMAYYDRAKVEKVFALDPFMHLPDLAAERVARSGLDVEPVSYTHLDVYKRQPRNQSQSSLSGRVAMSSRSDRTL